MIEATKDSELWKLWYAIVPSPDGMIDEINSSLGLQSRGILLPWAVIDNKTNKF